MRGFLYKQSQYLLQNELYALLVTAILSFVSFTDWLALMVISLITLRKGSYDGAKVLITGTSVAIVAATWNVNLPYTISAIVITYILSYLAALVLRASASWKMVGGFVLSIALAAILLIQELLPQFIFEQYQSLLILLKTIEKGDGPLLSLLTNQNLSQELLANYLLGVKALSIIFSVLVSLMMARSIQSTLFYPGGFREEMNAFRASRIVVILLVICASAAYQRNAIAISCLPVLVVYLMIAGMGLIFSIMSKKRNLIAMFVLLMPLIVIPYIILPVYVFFGSLDSVFNFRSRLLKGD